MAPALEIKAGRDLLQNIPKIFVLKCMAPHQDELL